VRDYGKVSPQFWTGDTGRRLRGNLEAQLVALYLFTCGGSSMTGVYYLPLTTVAHETGLTVRLVEKALAKLHQEGIAHYDRDAALVFVVRMAYYQVGSSLQKTDKRVKGIIREVSKYKNHRFVAMFWSVYGETFNLGPLPFEGASESLRSQDQDQEQEQEQDLSPSDSCAEPPAAASSPSVLTFPTVGAAPTWPLTEERIAKLAQTFPSVNVDQECRKALGWIDANPTRRKTPAGMAKFLFGWMQRVNDRGPSNDLDRRQGYGRRHDDQPLLNRTNQATADAVARFVNRHTGGGGS